MRYQTAWFCAGCGKELAGSNEKIHSGGECPKCASVGIRRECFELVRANPRWKFWKPQFRRI